MKGEGLALTIGEAGIMRKEEGKLGRQFFAFYGCQKKNLPAILGVCEFERINFVALLSCFLKQDNSGIKLHC